MKRPARLAHRRVRQAFFGLALSAAFSVHATELPTTMPTSATYAAAGLPDPNVIDPHPPTETELAGANLFPFIVHHGTTNYPSASGSITGGLTRWRGGRGESLCAVTTGLAPSYASFISARIRALAEKVGAPLDADPNCSANVRVDFTADPERAMSTILKWAARSLGVRFPHQETKLLTVSAKHPIQGYYITSGGGGSVLNTDPSLLGPLDLKPLWPYAIPNGLNTNQDRASGIVAVFIVVDVTKISGLAISSVTDYVAQLTLSVVQNPDHCDVLPSILDLMSTTCGSRQLPGAVTAGDVAFLKALYYENTGLGATLSRNDILLNMKTQFKH